ncbi:hypothetical protein L9F63_024889 [Diploptera punctata]|uniref:Ionotropic glutamate receptor C-terminal domain-containing protein n=1 Tax=Diploptera punctata TaxID=6984 RepID=A0AAD7ZEQ1_DIPPU|nr:hypothetical protein L9F63_024889 [Diploptera punctata]
MKLANGSWNGLLGLIQRKEAELTSEALTMSPSRTELVDFIAPIKFDKQYLITKRSDVFELNWNSFLLPFSSGIWLAVISIMLVLGITLWVTYKITYKWVGKSEAANPYAFHDVLFYIFGSFCQQGHDKTPDSMSGRVVYLVSYLTAVVLLAGYSAALISYLTLRKPVIPFTTFEGLLKDNSYKFGVTPFSSAYSYFEVTKDPLLKKLYRKFLRYPIELPPTTKDGLHRVCKDYKFTYLSSLDDVDETRKKLSCHLVPVNRAYIPGSRAMAVAKNSPYLGIFSH